MLRASRHFRFPYNQSISAVRLHTSFVLQPCAALTIPKAQTPLSRMQNSIHGSTPAPRKRVAMISGPLAPPAGFFEEHYIPRIDLALENGDAFVIGPGRGIDQTAVEYIIPKLPKEEVVRKISVFFYQGEDRMRKNATWYVPSSPTCCWSAQCNSNMGAQG
jgi:hypothetical protein